MTRYLVLAVAVMWLAWGVPAEAQITIPFPDFVAGTVANPDQVDANNAALSSQALNRTGGTMSGTLTTLSILPAVHDTYDIGVTGTRFQDLFLSGTITASGNVTIDTTTLFVNASNDRVGIGTTSPGRELTVSGSAPGVQLASTGGGITWGLVSLADGSFQLADDADSNPRLTATSAGAWSWIGDTSFNIGGANASAMRFDVTNSTSGAGAFTEVRSLSSTGVNAYLRTLSTGFTPSGANLANGSVLGASGASGLSIIAENATGDIRFYAGSTVEDMRLSAAILYIGDTSNADMTQGMTINQGAAVGDILAFKAPDVAHGLGVRETDTFATFRKSNASLGGLQIEAYSEATAGAAFQLFAQAATGSGDTTKSVNGAGYIDLRAFENSASVGANENLVVIRDGNATRFIFDAEGDAHNDGTTWTAYDSFDDLALIDTLDHVLDPTLRALERIDLDASRAWLTEAKLVSFDADGRPFVNTTRLQMLHNGAIRQVDARVTTLQAEIEMLRAELATLKGRF